MRVSERPMTSELLESAVAPHRSGKDTVTFRHSQELPYDLVERICVAIAERRLSNPQAGTLPTAVA